MDPAAKLIFDHCSNLHEDVHSLRHLVERDKSIPGIVRSNANPVDGRRFKFEACRAEKACLDLGMRAAKTRHAEMLFDEKIILLIGKSIDSAITRSGLIGFIAMTDENKKKASLAEDLALRSLMDFTGWSDWCLAGDEIIGEVHSFTFMRIPYFFGAYFVVDISLKDNAAKILPGK